MRRRQPDVCDPNDFEGRELDWDDHLRGEGWPERIGFALGEASVYAIVAAVIALIIVALVRR